MKGRSLEAAFEEIKAKGAAERETIEAAERAAAIINAISEARIRKGMTQRDLARKSGVPQPNIARIEAAKVMPRLDTLMRLAECVGVEIISVYPQPSSTRLAF